MIYKAPKSQKESGRISSYTEPTALDIRH